MANKEEIVIGRDSYIQDLKKLLLKPELLIVQPVSDQKKENN